MAKQSQTRRSPQEPRSTEGRRSPQERRSNCPINAALELFGDRWSLLIVRDLILHDQRAYKDFLSSAEGIATNVLADRLKRLSASEIITAHSDPLDGRKLIYRLTRKGIDLAPVLAELVRWSLRYEHLQAPPAIMRKIATGREQFLAELEARWEDGERRLRPRPHR